MTRFLVLLAGLLALATPAAADPISGLAMLGTTLFAGATWGTVAANMLASVAMSALVRALAPDQRSGSSRGGIRTDSTTAGEDQPQTIIFGRYATAGNHECPPYVYGIAGDKPVENLTYIVSLADYPIDGVESAIINGKNCVFDIASTRADGLYGNTCSEYNDRAWFYFKDGRQTVADTGLTTIFGAHPDRPWASTAVLKGVAYGVFHFLYDQEVWTGLPQVKAVVRGARLYDPRKDSTVGGSGSQRWADPTTWTFTENPVVMIYNLLRGLTLADGSIYGLGIPAERLPLTSWTAAMNACDATVAVSGGGTRPRYRAGIEFSVDQEPLDVIEEIGKSCGADLAEIAGAWRIIVGEPEVVSAYITDDDIIITSPEQFDPFPQLSETYNGITARFPKPASLWETAEARPIYKTALEAEDGGRRLVADLSLPTVSDGRQVRAIMREVLADHRRMRTHQITLPPQFLSLVPTKTISWTSSHNGYSAKLFEITAKSIDPLTLCSTFTIRERDPADYSPDMLDDAVLPSDPSIVVEPPTRVGIAMFAVSGITIQDATGAGRRPALRLTWDPDGLAVSEIAYEVRVEATGAVIAAGKTTDVARGQLILSASILPGTLYGARARAVGRRKSSWSSWITATTPNVKLKADDLDSTVTDTIAAAQASANAALANAATADGHANAAQATANAGAALAQQAADIDAVMARALIGGWAKSPTFKDWSGSAISNWSRAGTAYITKDTTGWLYGTAVRLAAPGSVAVQVSASLGSSQLNASADLAAEYVVLNLMLEYVSGDLTAGRATVHWKTTSGSFTEGTWPLLSTANGGQFDAIGIKATAGIRQAVQLLVKRPAAVATAADIRITIDGGRISKAGALTLVVHAADIRAATNAEIDQTQIRAYTDAAITTQNTTFTGLLAAQATRIDSVEARMGTAESNITTNNTARVNGDNALAATISTLTTRVGTVEATASDLATTVANGDTALSARLITVEARNTDGNLCRNPQFSGGAHDDWLTWGDGMSVSARGSGSTALSACPAPYCAEIAASSSAVSQATFAQKVAAKAGDRFLLRFDYASGGSSRDASLYVRCAWSDADGNAISSPQDRGVASVSATSWDTYETEITAPAGAAYVRFAILRAAGGAGSGYIANPYVARVDRALAKRLDSVIALKADSGNPAELVLASTATGDLTASTARLRADNILLDGTVAAKHLVVGDFANLVPDDQLQSEGSWSKNAGTWTLYPKTTLGDAQSIGEWRAASVSGTSRLISKSLPAIPGAEYLVAYQLRRTGGTKMSAYAQVRWYDATDALLGSSTINSYSGTSSSTLSRSGTATAPAGASYATINLFVVGDDTDGGVRFFAPSVRRKVLGTEIKDGEITTGHIATGAITAGKIDAGAITAAKMAANAIVADNIVAGTITADRIVAGAIGKYFESSAQVSGSDSTAIGTTETQVHSMTVPSSVLSGSSILLNFANGLSTQGGPEFRLRVKRNGTVVFTFTFDTITTEVDRHLSFSKVLAVDPSDSITFHLTRTSSGSLGWWYTVASALVIMR